MPQPLIDTTILRTDVWYEAVGETAEQDRQRAHRVVEHIRHRFPAVRDDDLRGERIALAASCCRLDRPAS
jgi:hypothetical protein